MIAHVSKKPYGFQVIVGEKIKGSYTKTFCTSTCKGEENAKKKADEHLKWYCETHNIIPPIKGFIHRSYKEVPIERNSSGFTGVYHTIQHEGRRPNSKPLSYWCAHYHKFDSKRKKVIRHKRYSVQKFGEDEAKRLAIEFRKGWEDALREGEESLIRFIEEDVIKTEQLKIALIEPELIEAKYAVYTIQLKDIKGIVGYGARIRIAGTKKDILTKFFNLKNYYSRSAAIKAAKKWIREIFDEYDIEDVTGKRFSP